MVSIKKSVELNIDIKKDTVTCFDLSVLQLIIGTKAVSGNYKLYDIEVLANPRRFVVKKTVIRRRIEEIMARLKKDMQYVEIMKQVV